MIKLEKLIPKKLHAIGHNVVVSEKTFDIIIQTLNNQTTVINDLIDIVTSQNIKTDELNNDIQKLATAIKTLMEE